MAMPLKRLGRSGLTVSRLVLGTMIFGDRTDEAEAARIIAASTEAGINFIDTADTYAGGRSEEIIGRAIAGDRYRWVLATKLGNPNGKGPNERGLSRKWMLHEVAASLKRLRTDTIDILYLHKEDPSTPLEEIVRTIRDLQRGGAIRYFGVSNFKAWRIARLHDLCIAGGIDPPIVCQPLYHALNRSVEVEILPVCADRGIGVVCYSPTARGVLTGKYAVDGPPPQDSRVGMGNRRILETEYRPDVVKTAQSIAVYARRNGIAPVAFAIAWLLANPIVTGAVIGPRNLEQLQSYLEAVDISWNAAHEEAVAQLVPPGTTAAHQLVDPAYPTEGRPTK